MDSDREPIGADEPLYRALQEDWVMGRDVLPTAIDLEGTSVYRERYMAEPKSICSFVRFEVAGVAVTTPATSSVVVNHPVEGATPWETFHHDDPFTDENGKFHKAHAEIRFRRVGETSLDNRKPKRSKKLKDLLKEAVASKMLLLDQ